MCPVVADLGVPGGGLRASITACCSSSAGSASWSGLADFFNASPDVVQCGAQSGVNADAIARLVWIFSDRFQAFVDDRDLDLSAAVFGFSAKGRGPIDSLHERFDAVRMEALLAAST